MKKIFCQEQEKPLSIASSLARLMVVLLSQNGKLIITLVSVTNIPVMIQKKELPVNHLVGHFGPESPDEDRHQSNRRQRDLFHVYFRTLTFSAVAAFRPSAHSEKFTSLITFSRPKSGKALQNFNSF
ncbi:hypothetical protein TDIS_0456 [Thermosulfurimonas dismutans]|uniref:Uncharacterized protein n=1 Tax=Thermosulfurimonas dismutans TaxID=999894 RepID=A0A179D5B8_9BACT|nr:hypothetical protein TDIS_0456 [Thermosulfurimonas dismutans]